ncbi:hypothetical protein E2320_021557, partial [Naja naja]
RGRTWRGEGGKEAERSWLVRKRAVKTAGSRVKGGWVEIGLSCDGLRWRSLRKVRDVEEDGEPITSSPPKWMAELENDDIDMLRELGSLTTANLMEKVRGLQNLAYQLGLDECKCCTDI